MLGLERMILVEADDDLAACVREYFSGRYEVCHLKNLAEADADRGIEQTALVFADVDANSPDQWNIVERFRKDYPRLKIVLTYLTPSPGGIWEARMHDIVDVLVRKPYSVVEVDKAIEASGKRYGD
jgi:DNA-binding NtrC family response regulator